MLPTSSQEESQIISDKCGEGTVRKEPSFCPPQAQNLWLHRIPNWNLLPPKEIASLKEIALPISLGFSQQEIAENLGINPSRVSQRLKSLRQACEALMRKDKS